MGRALRGLVLGKFMPPHLGHAHLIHAARAACADVTVVVGTLRREPIPGRLRYAWMRELFPDCRVLHLEEELPQAPEEHPDFWRIWRRTLTRLLPAPVGWVFASEPYGERLAYELGAAFVPVDLERRAVPISATRIRENPLRHWEFIPPPVRPYFVKRVCVFGPESTGKTTLARELAARFKTAWVPEFARGHLEARRGEIRRQDIPAIARGQAASEESLARAADRLLFCDTDLLTTKIWSETLFGSCPAWLAEQADRARYDLTLLCDVDVPWIKDSVRYLPRRRKEFFRRCLEELKRAHRGYVILSGSWEKRFETAFRCVKSLIWPATINPRY